MSINIKNEETERLARELSRMTGKSITGTVADALREKRQRLERTRRSEDIFETIMEISNRCSTLPDIDKRNPDEILGYDEGGTFGDGD